MAPRELNDISYLIIQSAIQVHRELGPGLLESIYRACLLYELRQRALTVIAKQLVPICYKGVLFEGAYRLDLLVEDQVVTARSLNQFSRGRAGGGSRSPHERPSC